MKYLIATILWLIISNNSTAQVKPETKQIKPITTEEKEKEQSQAHASLLLSLMLITTKWDLYYMGQEKGMSQDQASSYFDNYLDSDSSHSKEILFLKRFRNKFDSLFTDLEYIGHDKSVFVSNLFGVSSPPLCGEFLTLLNGRERIYS